VALVFIEVPLLPVLAQYHDIPIERLYLHPDIVEGLETEVLLDGYRIRKYPIDGIALDEETVTLVLEIAIDLTGILVPESCERSRETNVFTVRVCHPPLSEQVTCLSSLLAGSEKEDV